MSIPNRKSFIFFFNIYNQSFTLDVVRYDFRFYNLLEGETSLTQTDCMQIVND